MVCSVVLGTQQRCKLARWLRHLETVLASRLRNSPVLEYDRDLLKLPDGGTVALDFESLKEVSTIKGLLLPPRVGSLADLPAFCAGPAN